MISNLQLECLMEATLSIVELGMEMFQKAAVKILVFLCMFISYFGYCDSVTHLIGYSNCKCNVVIV